MAPVILAYRFVEKKQQIRRYLNHENPALEDAEWDSLHNKYAKSTVDTMRRMLGSYVKLGQFLALRPDIVPQVWTDELRTLESAVPAQSTELVHSTIERAYGKKVGEVFAEFDNKPVGSASIGQVHRATLNDGTRVAVKVQYVLGVPRCCGAFTPSTRVVSRNDGSGCFFSDFEAVRTESRCSAQVWCGQRTGHEERHQTRQGAV